jgi:hypothetical protein
MPNHKTVLLGVNGAKVTFDTDFHLTPVLLAVRE